MGPITLFDKSFLQSLSVDEAVWFDNFFLTNICPIFFVETMADVGKQPRPGRTPESEVASIAERTPERNSQPCQFHTTICVGNLLGHPVPMDGRIMLGRGKPVKKGDKRAVVFDLSPEAQALSRWQSGEFEAVEREFAGKWRTAVADVSLEGALKRITTFGVDIGKCKTLEDAKGLASAVVVEGEGKIEFMKKALAALGVPAPYWEQIEARWKAAGYPTLNTFAPYAAHVFTVDLFYCIAATVNLISLRDRVDSAYLFYLPFCMCFVSSDRFHQRCAGLFLRQDQQFVWGGDLKPDLKRLDEHYGQLPEVEKNKGLYHFATHPPTEGTFMVSGLWDRFLPGWRERPKTSAARSPETNARMIRQIQELIDGEAAAPADIELDASMLDAIAVQKKIHRKRGKWYQVDKDMEIKGDE